MYICIPGTVGADLQYPMSFKLPLNTSWSHLTFVLNYLFIYLSNKYGYDFYWLIRYVCADSEYNYKWYSFTKARTQSRRGER